MSGISVPPVSAFSVEVADGVSSAMVSNSSSIGRVGEDDAVDDESGMAGYSPRKSLARSWKESMSPFMGETAVAVGVSGVWPLVSCADIATVDTVSNAVPRSGNRAETPALHAKKSMMPAKATIVPAMILRVCSEREVIKLKIF